MSKLQIYTEKGAKSGTVDFPKDWETESNMNLLSQAFYVYQDRAHKGTSRVKTRSFVNATGAKMYRQKGTGGARHGDKKAPIFAGGGIAHGPKGVKRTLKLSGNQKSRSLAMALSAMAKDGKLVLVDKLAGINKTKLANELLEKICSELKLKRPSRILISLSEDRKEVLRSFRNIADVRIVSWNNLNSFEVLSSHLMVTEKEALDQKKGTKKSKSKTNDAVESKVEMKSQDAKPKSVKKEVKKTTKPKAVKKSEVKKAPKKVAKK